MLISCRWLSRHVSLEGIDLDDLANRFTLNVAELDGVHRVGDEASQAVVGHVLEANPVEGTHLNLCQVDVGAESARQIICGAPNVAAGQRVPVLLPGSVIGDLTIAERTVRGHLSQGMIASESELGLSDDHDGIMVLDGQPSPGTPLGELVDVTDVLFEIDNKSLTHRPDCWGHHGVAREVAAIIGRPLNALKLEVQYTDEATVSVEVQSPEACPRYLAVSMDNITVGPSPLWMRTLLHRVGVRAINNVVDATNFVMLDIGNPLHAFDRRQVKGDQIIVRQAHAGEAFTTLDGQTHTLGADDLLIGDAERGVALAGIMGGQNSEICDDTTALILEAANFRAATVRRTASRLGIRTDSSARFEKSLDPQSAALASRAFCALMVELDPSCRVDSRLIDIEADAPAPPTITLPFALVDSRLGVTLERAQIIDYLERLGFQVTRHDATLEVVVPSWRASKDIGIAADLIEEIGRSYGYDNIPPSAPVVQLSKPHNNAQKQFEYALRRFLAFNAGMDEVMTYSFEHDPTLEKLGVSTEERVTLRNPINAEMPAMRRHLGPNLLSALELNARRHPEVRLFEVGRVFHPTTERGELPSQPVTAGGIWAEMLSDTDPDARLFSQLKGVLMGLPRAVGRPTLSLRQGGVTHPWVHPVRQATIALSGRPIGYLGQAHPMALKSLDIEQLAVLFELDLDAYREASATPLTYTPIARYPSVFRDFAVIVDEAIRGEEIVGAIKSASPSRIRSVSFQSVYRGQGVPEGQKSMAWSVTMAETSGTLSEPEIREVEQAIWAALSEQVQGTPRA